MNSPDFDSVSGWYSQHKPLLQLFAAVITSIVVGAFTYFASADELKKVAEKQESEARINQMQEYRYHIDIISRIKPEHRPPEMQRALEDYKSLKQKLIGGY